MCHQILLPWTSFIPISSVLKSWRAKSGHECVLSWYTSVEIRTWSRPDKILPNLYGFDGFLTYYLFVYDSFQWFFQSYSPNYFLSRCNLLSLPLLLYQMIRCFGLFTSLFNWDFENRNARLSENNLLSSVFLKGTILKPFSEYMSKQWIKPQPPPSLRQKPPVMATHLPINQATSPAGKAGMATLQKN